MQEYLTSGNTKSKTLLTGDKMRCPRCGERDKLQILAVIWIQAGYDEDGSLQPVAGEEPDYSGNSTVSCDACGATGTVGKWQETSDEPIRQAPVWSSDLDTTDVPSEHENCPKCNSKMNIRENRSTTHKFWGCTQYPRCRGTRRYP